MLSLGESELTAATDSSSSGRASDPRRVGGKRGGGAVTGTRVCEGRRVEASVFRRLGREREGGEEGWEGGGFSSG